VFDLYEHGDLASMLRKEHRFAEDRARVYFCEMLFVIEYLHEKNIVFRDLKPENILIDARGHLVLTDFGIAKELKDKTNNSGTFCGSLAYMPPEILTGGSKHGMAIDFYLLGVVLYEMLTGKPPYFSKNRNDLLRNIKSA
jgi:serine/threonine protein kinase